MYRCSNSIQPLFSLVIGQWQEKCSEFGVDILHKYGGKLVGERSRRSCHLWISELLLADDAATVGTSRRCMEHAVSVLEGLILHWGLTFSIPEMKLLDAGVLCSEEEELSPLKLNGGKAECVTDFKYLGSVYWLLRETYV